MMKTFAQRPADALLCLGAMKAAALADGELSCAEIDLLRAAALALGVSVDPQELAVVSPEQLAASLRDAQERERVVQAMILMALMDGAARPEEAALVEVYAEGLGVSEPRVRNLRQLAQGRVRLMWLDLARRSFARPIFERALRERGLAGIWRIVAPMLGLGRDAALARRYRALGGLPAGTLGRAYADFIVANDLGFPGEGIVAEEGVWHDLSHVLAGYGTDPAGEVQVVSFIAGYSREDPFFWLFTIALQFHLGVKVSPYSPPLRGHFEPALVLAALQRGMQVRRDLSDGWDYWPDLPLPLDAVREKYSVPPGYTGSCTSDPA